MLARAFADVFPQTSVWDSMHPGEWILIGSKKPLALDIDALERRMSEPHLRADLRKIGIETPSDLLSLYLKGGDFLEQFAGKIDPVTDDRSVVDYTIPRHARSNFGLGEGLTGGLRISGAGAHGFVSELRFREFDAIYVSRDPVEPLVAEFGSHDPDSFVGEVAQRQKTRETHASRRASRKAVCTSAISAWRSAHETRDDPDGRSGMCRAGRSRPVGDTHGPCRRTGGRHRRS